MNATVYTRYSDRFEKRNGEWRIAHRRVLLDLTRLDPVTGRFGDSDGFTFAWGYKGKADPSYAR